MVISIMMVILVGLAASLYKRYVPVPHVPCPESGIRDPDLTVVDIRDYNNKAINMNCDSVDIPYAYLRRFYNEISPGKIHVIASDRLELNLGIRFLRKKGFQVVSYEMVEQHMGRRGDLEPGLR
jgi:hypothetical protein